MTYTLVVWGPVATVNGMATGPVDTARGLSDQGVLEMFDSVRSKGGICTIEDEDGFGIDPRDLGWCAEIDGSALLNVVA